MDNSEQGLKKYLQEILEGGDKKDKNYNAVKSIIETLPAGSLFSYFYQTYVLSPANRRLHDFFKALVEAIYEIEKKIDGFTLESLQAKPEFTTILMHSLQIVSRNHQKEKIEALKNAVINTALPNYLDDDKRILFLNFIDSFTVQHIKILTFIRNPAIWFQNNKIRVNIDAMGSTGNLWFSPGGEALYLGSTIESELNGRLCRILDARDYKQEFEMIFPKLDENNYFYNQVFRDLNTKGLVYSQSVNAIYLNLKDGSGTTDLGSEFVDFIKSL